MAADAVCQNSAGGNGASVSPCIAIISPPQVILHSGFEPDGWTDPTGLLHQSADSSWTQEQLFITSIVVITHDLTSRRIGLLIGAATMRADAGLHGTLDDLRATGRSQSLGDFRGREYLG